MFLSYEALAEFTGYKRPSDQAKYLVSIGIPHLMNGLGRPVVLESVVVDWLSPGQKHEVRSKRPKISKVGV